MTLFGMLVDYTTCIKLIDMKNTLNAQTVQMDSILQQKASRNQLKNIFSFLSPANPKLIIDEIELASD